MKTEVVLYVGVDMSCQSNLKVLPKNDNRKHVYYVKLDVQKNLKAIRNDILHIFCRSFNIFGNTQEFDILKHFKKDSILGSN